MSSGSWGNREVNLMKHAASTVTVLIAVLIPLIAGAAARSQHWDVTIGSIQATPCEDARVTLTLKDSGDAVVSEYAVPLDLGLLGVGTSLFSLQVPRLGAYTLTATDHGCAEGSGSQTTIPLVVSERQMPDQIILLAEGNDDEWRLSYFGFTRRLAGSGVLQYDADQRRLRNVSDMTIAPCPFSLWSPLRELNLINDSWEEGREYRYPTEADSLVAGGELIVEKSNARIVRKQSSKGEAAAPVLARILEARTIPTTSTFTYIGESADQNTSEPFPGHCDTYVLELFISPEYKQDHPRQPDSAVDESGTEQATGDAPS